MKLTKKDLAAAVDALDFSNPCEGHDAFAELRRDGDGFIVEMGCRTCNTVRGFIHPRSALDLAGPESDIGKQILGIFPEWGLSVQ